MLNTVFYRRRGGSPDHLKYAHHYDPIAVCLVLVVRWGFNSP